MIRFTAVTETEPLDNALDFLDDIDREVEEVGDKILRTTDLELLDALQDTPPKRNPNERVEWTNKHGDHRQRKAYFASDGFGKGIPTVRDNTLIDSWEIFGETSADGFNIVVRNTQKWSKFVVGSLAKNVARAARFQQKFHQNTGWNLATIPVQEWLEDVQLLFKQEFQARWRGAVTGRFRGQAFTSGRRRKRR